MKREPTSPGQILLHEFLRPKRISQKRAAELLGCRPAYLRMVIRGTAPLSPSMIEALAHVCGTSAEFWENAQRARTEWLTESVRRIVRHHNETLRKLR